jgi:hypothetical protein
MLMACDALQLPSALCLEHQLCAAGTLQLPPHTCEQLTLLLLLSCDCTLFTAA